MRTRHVTLGLAFLVGLGAGISVGITYAKHTIGISSGMMSQWAAVGTYANLRIFNINTPMSHTQERHCMISSASRKNLGLQAR